MQHVSLTVKALIYFPSINISFQISTEVQLVNKMAGTPKEFKANRPFLFYIEDERTGHILFAGRVNNPSLNN